MTDSGGGARASRSAVTAGAASVTITPPSGIPLSGFVGRGPALDIHDDLWATALVLSEQDGERPVSETKVAIVALDLIGLYSDPLVSTLKESVQRATGIPAERVFLACSHTHYGPVVAEHGDMPGGRTPRAAEYRAQLADRIARVVAEADQRRRPVTLTAGRGECGIGVNRRLRQPDGSIAIASNPEGPYDPDVQVLRFDEVISKEGAGAGTDAATVATIVNFACHPSSLEAGIRSISADFPGVMRSRVEEALGGVVLFIQGAAGDIDPTTKAPDWSLPRAFGESLAAEALRASAAGHRLAASPVTSVRERVGVPRRGASSAAAAQASVDELLALHKAVDAADPGRWWLELKIEEARAVHTTLVEGRRPVIEAEVSALRIGDAALTFAPAELFSDLGRAVKGRSPTAWTAVAGYTDGALWYVPTRAAYGEGGYEVDDACRVAAEAGELLVDRTVALLKQLYTTV